MVSVLFAPLQAGDARKATVYQIAGRIQLDGLLNESVWRENPSIGEFVQAEPRSGERPTEPTQVWLAYNKDTLYIAVRCQDSQPGKIVATEMTRDARVFSNDNIELLLDTYNDRRNAYYFATNPVGILVDGRISENRMANLEWNGIWNVRARRDDQGWSAEFEIPFKTLGFDPGSRSWGFNMSRNLGRLREMSRWASPSYDVRFFHVSRAGSIEGLEGLSQGAGLDIKPYAIGGVSRDIDASALLTGARDAGADVFYRVTSNLVSSTTINTDFAETEADTRQVNLTRFSLFFPERRSFFLEDAGIFEFAESGAARRPGGGGGGGGMGRNPDFLPFFSRRIGLTEDEEVPIRLGEKLTGTLGRFAIGLMDIQTGPADVVDTDTEIPRLVPSMNLAVARVKANFLSQSYIGALFTKGDPAGEISNHLAGLDLNLATSNLLGRRKNLSFSLFGSKTETTGVKGKDSAYGGEIAYPNDFVSASYRWTTIGANYNPSMGYVPRAGVRISKAAFELGPRPHFWGIRQMTFGFEYTDYRNLEHHISETRKIQVTPMEWRFNSGERLSYVWSPNLERLFEPWEIREGLFLPTGKYRFDSHRIGFMSSATRPVSFRTDVENGSFYSGTKKAISGEITWRKSQHLSTSVEMEQNWVKLKEGDFSTRLMVYRLDYAFTPLISLSNFVQYDTDSTNLGLQTRLRWIMKPGNEFHIVLNHSWQENDFDRFVAAQTHFRVKLNYTFRF